MSFKSENYLPTRFRDIKEFYDFCMANDPLFDEAESRKDKTLNNRFPLTADSDGIELWEKVLSITPNESDTLEDRRFRIITNLQKRTPYTWSQLHRMMDAICGRGNYEIKKGYFVLMVYLSMDSQSKLRSVMDMLRDVVPMHILLDISQILYYNFNVDIFSWGKNNSSIQILPYQQREYKEEVDAIIASFSITEKRIQILPFQQRYFNTGAVLQLASGVLIKGSIEIPCQKKN